jgi:hypothetical protein
MTTKICKKCLVEKDIRFFGVKFYDRDVYCRSCIQNWKKNSRYSKQLNRNNRNYDKQKLKAHNLVAQHVRLGKIIKPKNCEICEVSDALLYGHHANGYENDNMLNVLWVCGSCHKLEHDKMKVYTSS